MTVAGGGKESTADGPRSSAFKEADRTTCPCSKLPASWREASPTRNRPLNKGVCVLSLILSMSAAALQSPQPSRNIRVRATSLTNDNIASAKRVPDATHMRRTSCSMAPLCPPQPMPWPDLVEVLTCWISSCTVEWLKAVTSYFLRHMPHKKCVSNDVWASSEKCSSLARPS